MERTIISACVALIMVTSGIAEPIHQFLHRHMTLEERQHYLGSGFSDFEVIYISDPSQDRGNASRRRRGAAEEENLVLEAFGKPYNLRLERNRHILNEGSRIVHRLHGNDSREHVRPPKVDCHFLHSGRDLTAAVSKCWNGQLRGFISDGEVMVDIAPLPTRLQEMVHKRTRRSAETHGLPHLARRARSSELDELLHGIDIGNDFVFPNELAADEFDVEEDGLDADDQELSYGSVEAGGDRVPTLRGRRMIELGLYVDKAARETFLPFFENDSDAFIDFILGFINQIQALYYLPSLGTKVDISINYLEIMEAQQLKHYDGERAQLLTSFCRYNTKMNKRAAGRNDWDMGLYLSGLNFFEMKNGQQSPVTMGLAVISGVCNLKYSCVIGELGTNNDQGKPYPSAGFTSAFIMAHEIGHNLGMFHDSQKNSCPANGYIMSPSRGTKGETTWSGCSRQKLRDMPTNCLSDLPRKPAVRNHRIFRELPGQVYDAYDQCQLLLKDPDAELFSPQDLYNVCDRVKCKSPRRIGFYYSGPALEGTYCGYRRWCISGSCRDWSTPAPPIIEGGWGDWNVSACGSGCVEKATGIAISERRCDSPKPLNTEKRCTGPSTNTQFCDDAAICDYRLSPRQFASQKCREFSHIVEDIRPDGEGTQVPHSTHKPWSACSVYCRLLSGTWYTPRQDLNDMGINTYFPDGTWCHNDGTEDYYCQKHECKPKRADPPLTAPAGPARLSAEERFQNLEQQLPQFQTNQQVSWSSYSSEEKPSVLRAPPTATTPFFQPEPTPYPFESVGQSRRPPVVDGAAGGDRWREGGGGGDWVSADPTVWPQVTQPPQWYRPQPTDWPPNNGLVPAASTEWPVTEYFGSPTMGPGSPDWPFNDGNQRQTTWYTSTGLNGPTLAPEHNWLFGTGPEVTTTPTTTTTSLRNWLFLDEPSTTEKYRSPPGAEQFGWPREQDTQSSAGVGQHGQQQRSGWRSDLAEPTRWPEPEQQTRTGRVFWPDQTSPGSVRWPADDSGSTRWLVRPTMPTMAPPEPKTTKPAPVGGFLRNSFQSIWCRAFGTCR